MSCEVTVAELTVDLTPSGFPVLCTIVSIKHWGFPRTSGNLITNKGDISGLWGEVSVVSKTNG